MRISQNQSLTFICSANCPSIACPAEEYLLSRPDVLIWPTRNNKKDASSSITKMSYRLNLETEDIGNKFIETYKEVQKICAECHKQIREK